MSGVQFIERMACIHNKNKNPNNLNLEEMFPKLINKKTDKEKEEGDPRWEHLKLP